MIDNSRMMPLGTLKATDKSLGRTFIIVWANDKTQAQVPLSTVDIKSHGYGFGVVHNFFEVEPEVKSPHYFDSAPLAPLMAENHEINAPIVTPCFEYPSTPTVVLCGAGPSLKNNIDAINAVRDDVTVVTVGKSQNLIEGDYYVHLESRSDYVEDEKCGSTISHVHTTAHPGVASHPWKKTTWFSHRFTLDMDGVNNYHLYGNVTCNAFEFICKTLKAKKIIMVGMEHPTTRDWTGRHNYYWHGVALQAQAYWAGQQGIEVWNCTPTTSVVAGVILGRLNEAMG